MYQRITAFVLRLLRVPPEPQPPHGDPASLRVFRAGRNFFRLRLFRWGVTQLLALAGIIFWVTVFVEVEAGVRQRREARQAPVSPTSARNFGEYIEKIGAAQKPEEAPPVANGRKAPPRHRNRIDGWSGFKRMMVEMALWLPLWAFPLLWALKLAGILLYLGQLPVTYLIARLDYELRWYMVTDRSLRIRFGVWKVNESTMSFANIQQVEVSQGPLQRLLGLADVRVQSAGGGDYANPHMQGKAGEDMHSGLFHSVTNAPEIRDLILERLRKFRQAGLGDPEDHHDTTGIPMPDSPTDALAAARELLAEAKALRAALS